MALPLLFVGIYTFTRVILLAMTGIHSVPISFWPTIFIKGLWFDCLTTCVFLSPIYLFTSFIPSSWKSKTWYRYLRLLGLWGLVTLLLFGMASEITFWLEFSTRLNFIAVDYLLYTHEVIANIQQSYPLPLIFGAIGTAALLIVWIFFRNPPRGENRKISFILAVLLPIFALSIGRIEQMEGSGNAYAEELSGNGIFTFGAALRRNELDYDKFYKTMPQEEADAVLKSLDVERAPLSSILKSDMNDAPTDQIPFKRKPKNIVLVSIESLSASFVGCYGSPEGLTPNIDALSKKGMKVERFFATGTRTVRGLEALSLGTPPVPGQAIVRRPKNEHLCTIGDLLSSQDVTPYFIYGGYGYFDNMNHYFEVNNYLVADRRSFPESSVVFENAWGVADEVLYSNAIDVINHRPKGRPFFAHIMTTSNHRPYTYPDGRIDIPSPGGRAGAVKYTDYALGKFIEDAKKQPWFGDTLFVITADHCASVAGKTKLPVKNYRIPLIFYAPEIVRPSTFDPIVSQIDLMPTLIEVLGKKGDDHFFGRSFFEDGTNPERAFISNYQELGYLRGGILTVLLPHKKVEFYQVGLDLETQTAIPANTRYLREAIAYYQTASRAFKSGALTVAPRR